MCRPWSGQPRSCYHAFSHAICSFSTDPKSVLGGRGGASGSFCCLSGCCSIHALLPGHPPPNPCPFCCSSMPVKKLRVREICLRERMGHHWPMGTPDSEAGRLEGGLARLCSSQLPTRQPSGSPVARLVVSTWWVMSRHPPQEDPRSLNDPDPCLYLEYVEC